MRTYEERKTARIARLQARAASLASEGNERLAKADAIGSHIPMGQPILVGHHSERRHRRDLARIHENTSKGFEALKDADHAGALAARIERGRFAISSDDSDAIEQYRAKLDDAERAHDTLLDVNKRLRNGATDAEVAPSLEAIGWKDPLRKLAIWRSLGHKTVPTTNGSAEIRRLKARIAELEAKTTRAPVAEETINGVRLAEEDNRVRLYFPGKPSSEVRDMLRARGFLWAPSVGAWQRKSSSAGLYAAREMLTWIARGAA